jgi:4-amino-4-deoxy-L-arabinose transferase-like glycosyltransferase
MGADKGGGWGMLYLVAVIYGLVGRNMLAVQFFNAVLGAVTAPIIYLCTQHVIGNSRVARIACLFVAFYPSLVLWSSQALKDGPIVFLIALSMLAALELGERFRPKHFILLICSLFALLSMRFYIFYMMVGAIGGAFLIGMRAVTTQSFIRQMIIIIGVGLALTFMGVGRYAGIQFETYGSLEAVQRSRLDQAQTGKSGFDVDVDVTTTSGALSALPIGLLYLLFAPFPWQLASLRQSITLPEMIVWWASFPLLVLGLWYTLKYRLRPASPILIFTPMLTLAYSLFQGNVGTAYRQRSQLLIFYFIFVAVGYVLLMEKREDKKRQELLRREASTTFAHPSSSNI